MLIFQDKQISSSQPCPYLSGQSSQNEFFLAKALNATELDSLLAQGWRRFAYYYFRPACAQCQACIPIRIETSQIKWSKSQRRLLNKNQHLKVVITDKQYRRDIYDIYQDHSQRFANNEIDDEQQFKLTHFQDTCPSLQIEFYLESTLIAVSFIDQGTNSLSSSYFIYRQAYSNLSLGTYSAMIEIQYCQQQQLDYYYLGYYIKDNASMAYKNRFYPQQLMQWSNQQWHTVLKPTKPAADF